MCINGDFGDGFRIRIYGLIKSRKVLQYRDKVKHIYARFVRSRCKLWWGDTSHSLLMSELLWTEDSHGVFTYLLRVTVILHL